MFNRGVEQAGECHKTTYSQLSLYRSLRDLYNLFDITKFRYKGGYIDGLEVLGENIHFDIRGYFVISEFDIEGVDFMLVRKSKEDFHLI